jgi:hypothetical protein
MNADFVTEESGAAKFDERLIDLRKKYLNEWLCWLLEKFD